MSLDLGQKTDIDLTDEAATIALGGQLAVLLGRGDIVYLKGDLGAGKSTLARALIRALTTPDQDVPSPTFTLMQTYEAAGFEICHLDLYRIKSSEEIYELGLDERIGDSLMLIEWPERLGDLGFDDYLEIELEPNAKSEYRFLDDTIDQNQDLDPPNLGRRAHLIPHGRFRPTALDTK